MNEPWNRFREYVGTRPTTDIEKVVGFKGTKEKKMHHCSILKVECEYHHNDVQTDCRQCSFALAFMVNNPAYLKGIGTEK